MINSIILPLFLLTLQSGINGGKVVWKQILNFALNGAYVVANSICLAMLLIRIHGMEEIRNLKSQLALYLL